METSLDWELCRLGYLTDSAYPICFVVFANAVSVFCTVVCEISVREVCVQCLNHFIH